MLSNELEPRSTMNRSQKPERNFGSCDEWWRKLSPVEKMWIHCNFHDLPGPGLDQREMKGAHDFNLSASSGTECGGDVG